MLWQLCLPSPYNNRLDFAQPDLYIHSGGLEVIPRISMRSLFMVSCPVEMLCKLVCTHLTGLVTPCPRKTMDSNRNVTFAIQYQDHAGMLQLCMAKC